ncbi:hypothetical protein MJO28_012534 [Puccinia striiformis f. sp. tritici]|uniref:Uncharacterized protein n=1 Tax=Puccinia striiformis f. sp. tritici TaxID=168172 RepID=A0ACC0E0M3_9BASI|nr:hypothetical protein MJO28_012534 [Puccinia striiformis f. sp. tritici]
MINRSDLEPSHAQYCPKHSLLFLDEQEWVGKASPDIPTPVLYGLLAQAFKRKIATNTNHPDEPASKHHCKGVAIDLDEIEILDLAPPIQSPGTNNNPGKNKKKTFRFPMLPSWIGMERIPMEEYLNVVHIPANDVSTQDLLLKWGITHWSHFWSSDKDDLVALGFLPRPASLLWEGVPRLDEYVDVMEHSFCPAFTSPPPLASGSGLAHQVIYDESYTGNSNYLAMAKRSNNSLYCMSSESLKILMDIELNSVSKFILMTLEQAGEVCYRRQTLQHN